MRRRAFLKSAAASAVSLYWAPFARAASGYSIREALPTFKLDPSKVAALKKGVAVMKARKPSDPTSWFFQAAIHAISPPMLAKAVEEDPAVAQVDQQRFWNQCPHFSNGSSADFLIWHRAYLYYFERVLRAAAEEPGLTVPYWNYSDPSQRGCPDIFAEPDLDPATQKPRNPLYDARRNLVWVFGLGDLNDNAVSTKKVLSSPKYFDLALPQNAVGGSWKDRDPASKGAMEQSPHDNIHFITGGVIGDTGGGLMASPRTSAHDPLFWIHHSNIDRLWNVWGCQQTSSWGDPPPDAWLDEKAWWFYDFDGSAANLPRRSYIDSRALGYVFDDEDLSCTPVSSQPLPTPPLVVAQEFNLILDLPRAEFPGLALSTSADAQATLPVDDQLTIQTAGINKLQQRVMLELADVTFAEPPLVGFTVYAWTDQQPQPVELGTLNLFGLQHDDQMHSSQRGQRFDVTDLFKGPGAFHILVRPFELLSLKPGSAPLPRRGGVRIGAFRVLVVRREITGLKQ